MAVQIRDGSAIPRRSAVLRLAAAGGLVLWCFGWRAETAHGRAPTVFPPAGSYVPVQPERLLDTRSGPGQTGYRGGKPAAGQTVTLKVTATGTTSVPATASAVVLNVTGTGATGDGFVTVWPCDQTQPTASNLNLTTGGTAPNVVIAKISAVGTVCLFTQSGTDLIADINGYFPGGPPTGDFVVGGTRPVTVHTPANYNPATPAPLLIMLHGYSVNGAVQESYLQLAATASADGILYASPDGTTDNAGNRFWNATDACCDLFHSGVDDSAYVAGLIAAIKTAVAIDPKRVFIVGHSNGGFMAYRLACEHASDIAAIVSLAGATFNTPSACTPTAPVSVLEIHGTADATISYTGGAVNGVAYPSAPNTVRMWAASDGCSQTADSPTPPSHTITTGSAATVTAYSTGCTAGSHAELWTLPAGQHVPGLLHPNFETQVITYLLAHPKP